MTMKWKGVMPAITTCFNEDLSIDHEFVARHSKWLVDNGCTGIVTPGSLGEGATMDFAEKQELWQTCVSAIGDRAPVVAAISALSTVEASMDDLSMLPPGAFEIVIQPVSTCYAPDVAAVYREVARVTAPGGLYISQHKQPASLQGEVSPSARGYTLTEPYYRSGPLPSAMDGLQHREGGTVEFLHRWSELLGGLCRAGFVIEDLVEPRHEYPLAEPGMFGHRCRFLPPFVTVKARRVADDGPEAPKIWTP